MTLPAWMTEAAGRKHGGRAAMRSGAFALSANAIRLVANLASVAILARLLTPTDFGLMGMVAPFIAIITVFADGGVNFHTLQRTEIEDEEMTLTFWISFFTALAIAVLFAASTPALAWLYDEPLVTPLGLALSLVFMVRALSMQHVALCRRCLRQDIIAVSQISSAIGGLAVATAMAYAGAGVWALVGLQCGRAIFATGWVMGVTRWLPGPPRRHPAMREILGFGWAMVAARAAQVAGQSVDKVLLGWAWGAASLGQYQVAYQLLVMPLRQIQTPLAGVAVPYLSQRRDDEREFMKTLARTIALLSVLIAPAMAVGTAVAEPLVVTVLGAQWAPSAAIIALFAAAMALESARMPVNWSFLALGRPWLTARWNAFGTGVIAAGFLGALSFGPLAMALSLAITQAVLLPLSFVYASRRTGRSYGPAFRALTVPALTVLVAGGATLFLTDIAPVVERAWSKLVVAGAIWAPVTGIAALWIAPPSLRQHAVALLRRGR